MNDSIRRTVLLHLNTEDVEKKMQNLTTRLENARREKEALEKKAADGGSLTAQETLKLRDFTKEVSECEKGLAKMRSTKQQVDAVLKNMSHAGPREHVNVYSGIEANTPRGSCMAAQWMLPCCRMRGRASMPTRSNRGNSRASVFRAVSSVWESP